MITLVVIFNLLITLVNLFLAWRIWQLLRWLANLADTLTKVERSTHLVLCTAPSVILKAERGAGHLRRYYRRAYVQLQRGKQVLTLFNLGMKMVRE